MTAPKLLTVNITGTLWVCMLTDSPLFGTYVTVTDGIISAEKDADNIITISYGQGVIEQVTYKSFVKGFTRVLRDPNTNKPYTTKSHHEMSVGSNAPVSMAGTRWIGNTPNNPMYHNLTATITDGEIHPDYYGDSEIEFELSDGMSGDMKWRRFVGRFDRLPDDFSDLTENHVMLKDMTSTTSDTISAKTEILETIIPKTGDTLTVLNDMMIPEEFGMRNSQIWRFDGTVQKPDSEVMYILTIITDEYSIDREHEEYSQLIPKDALIKCIKLNECSLRTKN